MLVVGGPASAVEKPAWGGSFHASIDGWETGFVPGPGIPEGRCPGGAEWMLLTAGVGEATRLGTFEYTSEHCSWVVTPTPTGAIGKLGGGIMIMSFSEGDLTLAYSGTWKFDGDLTTGDGIAKIHQKYRVVDGTGVFEDARGSGHIGGVDDFHHILFDVRGSLHLVE